MASPYVSDMLVEKLLAFQELELRNFLAGTMGRDTILGVVRGDLFKSFVHQVLPKGGKFSVRYLDPGEHAVSLAAMVRQAYRGPHKIMSPADVLHDAFGFLHRNLSAWKPMFQPHPLACFILCR